MNAILVARLDQAFGLTHDLINHLDDASIGLDLPNLPSNTMASQLWCVVGARGELPASDRRGEWRGSLAADAADDADLDPRRAALDRRRVGITRRRRRPHRD